ncbi:MAG TPA: glycosyltransferase [Allosphingosinicella sp.]|jgi:glycosyltransferase involved in cell wall biosynthesis
MSEHRHKSIVFISSNPGWGGSEELWSAAAIVLAEAGHRVTVIKDRTDEQTPRLARLKQLGCLMVDLVRLPLLPRAAYELLALVAWPLAFLIRGAKLRWGLWRARPDFILVSQGGNTDGLFHLKRVLKRGTRYGIVCQKAAEMYWPNDRYLGDLRAAYAGAQFVWFVSEHNKRLTEEQLAMPLPQARIVSNPFLVPWQERSDWPEGEDLRLACVGRLLPREKGQDIVLRVLARDKWRARPLSVTFFGSGDHRHGLADTAQYLGLSSVRFGGYVEDVARIWDDHHGLLLPSHCEGLPLVLVEAMLSARVPVVTNVAGNPEVVEDGVTGFLASAPSDGAVDEALERAWQARASWREIGRAAATSIRRQVPQDPGADAAAMILEASLNGGAVPGSRFRDEAVG